MKRSHDWWFSIQSIAGWLLEDVPFPSAVRCVGIRLQCCLIVSISHPSGISIPLSLLMQLLLGWSRIRLASLTLAFIYQPLFFYIIQWRILGRGRGGLGLPLIFRPEWGPKGRKTFFWDILPPPPPPLVLVSWYGNFKPRLVTLPNLGYKLLKLQAYPQHLVYLAQERISSLTSSQSFVLVKDRLKQPSNPQLNFLVTF